MSGKVNIFSQYLLKNKQISKLQKDRGKKKRLCRQNFPRLDTYNIYYTKSDFIPKNEAPKITVCN